MPNVYPGVQGAEPPGGVQGQSPWFTSRTRDFPILIIRRLSCRTSAFDSSQFRKLLCRVVCAVMHCTALRPALHPALRPVLRAALSAAFYSALCVALTRVLPCVVLPCCTVFETAGARRGVTQPVVLPVVLWGQRLAGSAPCADLSIHPPMTSTSGICEPFACVQAQGY